MLALLVASALAQPFAYNPYRAPIMLRVDGALQSGYPQYTLDCASSSMTCSADAGTIYLASLGGGGGAPTTAGYWTKTAEAGLSNEFAMGTLGNGLVLNTTTTGVPTIYAGATCGANQFATQTNASGALTCAQPSFANISGTATTAQLPTIPVTKGGTNLTTIAANQVWTGTAADTVVAKTVPDCDDSAGQHLNFDNATQTWTCGTTGSGGYATIQEEGTPLTQRTTLNFIGTSITCVDDTTRTNCTISGGGGGISYAEAVAATLGGF